MPPAFLLQQMTDEIIGVETLTAECDRDARPTDI
jgi:hypothetical protein